LFTVMAEQAPAGVLGTPTFLTYLGDRALDLTGAPAAALGVRHLIVGAEPGGGIPSIRAHLEQSWGATCCEVLGNSDIAPIVWGECMDRSGMHFMGHDLVHPELVEVESGRQVEPAAGVSAELVYT